MSQLFSQCQSDIPAAKKTFSNVSGVQLFSTIFFSVLFAHVRECSFRQRRRQCFKTFNYSFTRGVTNSRASRRRRRSAQKVNPSIEGEANRQILSCSLFTSINLETELFSPRSVRYKRIRFVWGKNEEEVLQLSMLGKYSTVNEITA